MSLLLSASALAAPAQDFIGHLREQRAGQGTVKVTESPDIDRLVNGTATAAVAASDEAARKLPAHKDSPAGHASEGKAATTTATAETPASPDATIDTRRKVMRGQKVTGYRVQVYSGGNSREDKNRAQRTGNAMKEAFPTQPVFVHFYSPRWVCRIGNFVERSEAAECLRQVKALGYSQACIVKGTITVK